MAWDEFETGLEWVWIGFETYLKVNSWGSQAILKSSQSSQSWSNLSVMIKSLSVSCSVHHRKSTQIKSNKFKIFTKSSPSISVHVKFRNALLEGAWLCLMIHDFVPHIDIVLLELLHEDREDRVGKEGFDLLQIAHPRAPLDHVPHAIQAKDATGFVKRSLPVIRRRAEALARRRESIHIHIWGGRSGGHVIVVFLRRSTLRLGDRFASGVIVARPNMLELDFVPPEALAQNLHARKIQPNFDWSWCVEGLCVLPRWVHIAKHAWWVNLLAQRFFELIVISGSLDGGGVATTNIIIKNILVLVIVVWNILGLIDVGLGFLFPPCLFGRLRRRVTLRLRCLIHRCRCFRPGCRRAAPFAGILRCSGRVVLGPPPPLQRDHVIVIPVHDPWSPTAPRSAKGRHAAAKSLSPNTFETTRFKVLAILYVWHISWIVTIVIIQTSIKNCCVYNHTT